VKRPHSDARTQTFHGNSGGGSAFSAVARESEPIAPGAQRLESKICEGGFGSHRFLRPITGSAKNNPVKVCAACTKRMRQEEIVRAAKSRARGWMN
jgi:hypothetical protein